MNPQTDLKIIDFAHIPSNFKGRYDLYSEEKIRIIQFDNQSILLKQRNELIPKCHHRIRSKVICNNIELT